VVGAVGSSTSTPGISRALTPGRLTDQDGSADPSAGTAVALLGSYRHSALPQRELIVTSVDGATLVIDRLTASRLDQRLVGGISPYEAEENAHLLADLYVADPTRGHCRAVTARDLQEPATTELGEQPVPVDWRAPLIAGVGTLFRLNTFNDEASRRSGGRAAPATTTDSRCRCEWSSPNYRTTSPRSR
jgi:hypothetical protein